MCQPSGYTGKIKHYFNLYYIHTLMDNEVKEELEVEQPDPAVVYRDMLRESAYNLWQHSRTNDVLQSIENYSATALECFVATVELKCRRHRGGHFKVSEVDPYLQNLIDMMDMLPELTGGWRDASFYSSFILMCVSKLMKITRD